MNDFAMGKLHSEKPMSLPNVNSLLKISFGLILFTMVSFAFVYAETIPVDVEGNSFDIEYDVTGMTISSIEADTDFISLILTVDVTASNGILDIVLDRSFFDSTFEGLDDDFIILADGEEPTFSETNTTSESRTLRIELSAGNEEIEIIGSVFGDSDSITVPDTDDAAAAKAAADAAAAKAAADAAAAKAAADAAAAKAAADAAADAAAAKAAADAAAAKAAAATSQTQPTQCGPGTILQNGACVLDERCGPGTLLKDGVCVLDSTSISSGSSVGGMGKEMVMGVIIAFVSAGTVAVVFGIISKASKSSS
ncbi:MAG: hypothetical protein OEL52_02780 [Nitrosopumilus sp.]|nr:hypothetical protein [Nitrosopumilus sp.]